MNALLGRSPAGVRRDPVICPSVKRSQRTRNVVSALRELSVQSLTPGWGVPPMLAGDLSTVQKS